jgi:hypothetical protein
MMLIPQRPPDCNAITAHDVGSRGDIEAIGLLMPFGFFIPSVQVARGYARGSWQYPGGGMSLFHRMPSGWKYIAGAAAH